MNTSRTEVTAGARTPITAGFPAEANPTKGFPGARLINVNKDVQNPNESSAQLLANSTFVPLYINMYEAIETAPQSAPTMTASKMNR